LAWLLRRKLEHATFQMIVEYVENAVEATGAVPAREARLPAICFIDLSGYTALIEELGDLTAAAQTPKFESIGRVQLKGIDTPVELFSAT